MAAGVIAYDLALELTQLAFPERITEAADLLGDLAAVLSDAATYHAVRGFRRRSPPMGPPEFRR